jgi:hypothetical protein
MHNSVPKHNCRRHKDESLTQLSFLQSESGESLPFPATLLWRREEAERMKVLTEDE